MGQPIEHRLGESDRRETTRQQALLRKPPFRHFDTSHSTTASTCSSHIDVSTPQRSSAAADSFVLSLSHSHCTSRNIFCRHNAIEIVSRSSFKTASGKRGGVAIRPTSRVIPPSLPVSRDLHAAAEPDAPWPGLVSRRQDGRWHSTRQCRLTLSVAFQHCCWSAIVHKIQ